MLPTLSVPHMKTEVSESLFKNTFLVHFHFQGNLVASFLKPSHRYSGIPGWCAKDPNSLYYGGRCRDDVKNGFSWEQNCHSAEDGGKELPRR